MLSRATAIALAVAGSHTAFAQAPQDRHGVALPAGTVLSLPEAARALMPSKAPAIVTIEVSPADIETGQSATITWSSQNVKPGAKPCTASGAWSGGKAASGSESVKPAQTGSYAYTLTCRAAQNGPSGTGTATLDVSDATPPPQPATISITVAPTSVPAGTAATLTWSSTNLAAGATPCTASGAWAGAKAGSGSESVTPAQAGSYSYTLTCQPLSGEAATGTAALTATALPPQPGREDKILTLTNATGAVQTNYPIQVGWPEVCGETPHSPQAVIAGVAIPTQADVKKRCPDGSAKYSVLSFLAPQLPVTGTTIVNFQDQPNATPGAIDAVQLLKDAGADAAVEYTAPAILAGTVDQDQSVSGWQTAFTNRLKLINNGALAIRVNAQVYEISGIDLTKLTSTDSLNSYVRAAFQKAGYPVVVLHNGYQGKTYAYGGADIELKVPSTGTDLGPLLFKNPTVTGPNKVTSAAVSTMAADGKCKPWKQGPISVTLRCGDIAGSYDVALTGHKSIRPRFDVTIWFTPKYAEIDVITDITNSEVLKSEVYNLRILTGTGLAEAYKQELYAHPLMTRWKRTFQLGAAPNPQVSIKHDVGYLVDTGFMFLYDPNIALLDSVITNAWAAWAKLDKSIGAKLWWELGMANTGQRSDIGPNTTWAVRLLYSGDWRARIMALGMADAFGSFPYQITEGNAQKKLARAQTAPALGQPLDPYARPTSWGADIRTPGSPADKIIVIGGPAGAWSWDIMGGNGWTVDLAHLPEGNMIPAVLTGIPFYLDQEKSWTTAAIFSGAPGDNCNWCRGKPGAAVAGQVRAQGWGLRNIINGWILVPDDDPWSQTLYDAYVDSIATWEGGRNVISPRTGSAMWNFGKQYRPNLNGPLHWFTGQGSYAVTDANYYNLDVACDATAYWMDNWVIQAIGEGVRRGLPGRELFDWVAENVIWQTLPPTTEQPDGTIVPAYNAMLQSQYTIPNRMWVTDSAGTRTCVPLDTPANSLLAWAPGPRGQKSFSHWDYQTYMNFAMGSAAYVSEIHKRADVYLKFERMYLDSRTADPRFGYGWDQDPRYKYRPRSVH